MRLKDELLSKGIPVRYHEESHDGEARYGFIRKELKIFSPSDWGDGKYSIVGLYVNMQDETIGIELLDGTMPFVKNLFWALLADRDIRLMIEEYQFRNSQYVEKEKVVPFKVWKTEE